MKAKLLVLFMSPEILSELKQLQVKLEEHARNLETLVGERTKALKEAEWLAAIGATAGMVGHDIEIRCRLSLAICFC